MVNTRIRPSSSKILPKWLYPISACFLFVHCRMQYFVLFFSFLPGIVYGRYGIINFYIWIYSYRYFKRLSKNQLRNGKKKSKKQQTNKNDKRNQNNCILVHLNLIENPVTSTFLCSFFQIDYPNVNVSAEPGGDLTFEVGDIAKFGVNL